MSQPLRIAHVITGLDQGGAETMLRRLLSAVDRQTVDSRVVALAPGGVLREAIVAEGTPVEDLGMRPGRPTPGVVDRLARRLRETGADVVQTWLYHADLVGGLAARRAGVPVAWGLHNTFLGPGSKWHTRLTRRLLAHYSHRLPQRIAACAQIAADEHVKAGYAAERIQIIHNGIDTAQFRPDPEAREAVRAELGLAADQVLVGHVGRFHPDKDHATLLAAAAQVPGVGFLLCGREVTAANPSLAGLLTASDLAERVLLLGPRDDVPRLLAACDLAVSSSRSEAFPLAVGEAMACGLPCVVTDVGDSAAMVADTGRVVPREDPAALAAALADLAGWPAAERTALGQRARQRVCEHYSLAVCAAAYQALWSELAGRQPAWEQAS